MGKWLEVEIAIILDLVDRVKARQVELLASVAENFCFRTMAQYSRFTHYYFNIRDEILGPMVMRVASFFPF